MSATFVSFPNFLRKSRYAWCRVSEFSKYLNSFTTKHSCCCAFPINWQRPGKISNIIIALIARFSSSDIDMIWVKTKALIATALYDGKTSGAKYDQAICYWKCEKKKKITRKMIHMYRVGKSVESALSALSAIFLALSAYFWQTVPCRVATKESY